MLLSEIKLDESISSEIQKNLDWLKEVLLHLRNLSVSGRFSNIDVIKIEELFTTALPAGLEKYFRPSKVRLGRVTAVNINVKEYIEKGKLSIYQPLVTSCFKVTSISQFRAMASKLATSGAGFIKTDFNGDPETFSGFGIAYILPTKYVKAIIPFSLLIKLGMKFKLISDAQLLAKAKQEQEVMVILNDFKLDLTSADIIGVIEREGHYARFYANADINSGDLKGFPLFPKSFAELDEH